MTEPQRRVPRWMVAGAGLVAALVLLEVIARINAELGTTAMVITHNAAIAAIADRVLRLGDGRIVGVEKPPRKLTPAEISW